MPTPQRPNHRQDPVLPVERCGLFSSLGAGPFRITRTSKYGHRIVAPGRTNSRNPQVPCRAIGSSRPAPMTANQMAKAAPSAKYVVMVLTTICAMTIGPPSAELLLRLNRGDGDRRDVIQQRSPERYGSLRGGELDAVDREAPRGDSL